MALTSNSRFGQAALAAQLASTGPPAFLLAMFLVYLVMAAQFNSWRYPIYLLLPVPLAVYWRAASGLLPGRRPGHLRRCWAC